MIINYEMDENGVYLPIVDKIPGVEEVEAYLIENRFRYGLMRMEYLQEKQEMTFDMYLALGQIQEAMVQTHYRVVDFINNYVEKFEKELLITDYEKRVQEINMARSVAEEIAIKEYVEVLI